MLKEYLKTEKIEIDMGSFYQKMLMDYVLKNANDTLAEKIIKSGKNMADCFTYVFNEIKKEYVETYGEKNGGCAGDDMKLCGLAMHYFEEDSISKGFVPTIKASTKTASPKVEQPKIEETKEIEEKPNKVVKPKELKKSKLEKIEEAFGGMTLFG